jgi:hypothetical protein
VTILRGGFDATVGSAAATFGLKQQREKREREGRMTGFLRILIVAPVALIGYTLLYLAVRTFIEYRPNVATGPIVIVGQLSSAWYWAPLMFGAIAAFWYVRRY